MTNFSIAPDQTYALVVGIEKYEDGRDLNGPAGEAIRFAQWLIDRGVPIENIFLFASFLEDNESLKNTINIDIKLPTEENIREILDEKLLLEGKCGELLHVFWSGHGFITQRAGEFTRRVYYQNSDRDNFYNLNLGKLEKALKTSPDGTGFRHQLFLNDVCGTILDASYDYVQSYESSETPCRCIPGNNFNKQEIFYGASELDVSIGKLSRLILEEISEEKSLFPDANRLYDALRPLIPELKYRKFNSDHNQFEDDGCLPQPKTILADRHEIINFFNKMISGLTRERIISIKLSDGKERELLRQRLIEEVDNYQPISSRRNTIYIKLLSASKGVSYIFYRISEELGVENFPNLSKKVRNYLERISIPLSDDTILEEDQIATALNVQQDKERKIRLSELTKAFFQDLRDIIKSNKQNIVIIIDEYEERNAISELLQWIKTKFASDVTKTQKLILVILGSYSLTNSPEYKFFELNDSSNRIRLRHWLSYCKIMKYNLNEDLIRQFVEILNTTDLIYQTLECYSNYDE
jgi:hypothetical protein